MDESRKQFEAEMAKLGDCVDMRRAKNGDEDYMEWDVLLAWKMWQASRDSVVVQLPTTTEGFGMYSSGVAQHAIDLCAECIEEAGIKVEM